MKNKLLFTREYLLVLAISILSSIYAKSQDPDFTFYFEHNSITYNPCTNILSIPYDFHGLSNRAYHHVVDFRINIKNASNGSSAYILDPQDLWFSYETTSDNPTDNAIETMPYLFDSINPSRVFEMNLNSVGLTQGIEYFVSVELMRYCNNAYYYDLPNPTSVAMCDQFTIDSCIDNCTNDPNGISVCQPLCFSPDSENFQFIYSDFSNSMEYEIPFIYGAWTCPENSLSTSLYNFGPYNQLGVTYSWNFGDGQAFTPFSSGIQSHAYYSSGDYLVAVVSQNGFGDQVCDSRVVTVSEHAVANLENCIGDSESSWGRAPIDTEEEEFGIYPNPILKGEVLQLSTHESWSDAPIKIKIFNYLGQDLTSEVSIHTNKETGIQVSLNSIPSGNYFLVLSTNDSIETHKFQILE